MCALVCTRACAYVCRFEMCVYVCVRARVCVREREGGGGGRGERTLLCSF